MNDPKHSPMSSPMHEPPHDATGAPKSDPRDRLYNLLPVIHRLRDSEQRKPLHALLQVIAEQVNLVEEEIRQLYDNWFIETCQDWVVPYIGELISYTPVHEAGEPSGVATPQVQARSKIMNPRREVANTIRYRRRKGALALLELLAHDTAGWPARVVEFYKLLNWTQNLNHQRPMRGRTVDLRDSDALDLGEGPFSQVAHTVDIRRTNSSRTVGYYNIPSLGLFVWRLRAYSVTSTQAYCLEEVGPHTYTFSALGNDTQLYINPEREAAPTDIAGELNVPGPIRRRALEKDLQASVAAGGVEHLAVPTSFYGEEKSFVIWAPNWPKKGAPQPVPSAQVIAADLSDWVYRPQRGYVAVDPVLGRIAFPPKQLPKLGVQVTYHYGFSADMGGGEYARSLVREREPVRIYRVTEESDSKKLAPMEFSTISGALAQWKTDKCAHAVIEIMQSHVCGGSIDAIEFEQENQTLTLRAAPGTRPILRLLDYKTDRTDSLAIHLRPGCRMLLDGLLITGRSVHVESVPSDDMAAMQTATDAANGDKATTGAHNHTLHLPYLPSQAMPASPAYLYIRHCTLVPGWSLHNDCEPKRPAEPSLELYNLNAHVLIDKSILGSIQVQQDQVKTEPLSLHLRDSILDATDTGGDGPQHEALCAPGSGFAHAVLTIQDSTVLGKILTHTIELGENTIFDGHVQVVRSQRGCLRFSYVPPESRTPRRYNCQPDLVEQAINTAFQNGQLNESERDQRIPQEKARVQPRLNSRRYGTPTYCQLANHCAEEIKRGADDESEMGAFHDLYQPQRLANLQARLDEFTPAEVDAGIIFAS